MNWKEFLKKYWYFILVLIMLVILSYPKYCGNWASTAANRGYTYDDCDCLGLKLPEDFVHLIGGGRINCWGIILSRTCYENRYTEEEGSFRHYKPCE